MTTGRRYLVSGKVQGEGFRFFAEDAARREGLTGFVRNLADGRVEVVAEATVDTWKEFVGKLEQGPTLSKVSSVVVEPTSLTEPFTTFEIRY